MSTRRGLSTIVGAVFFIIAISSVITYASYSMNSIGNFAQSVIVNDAENINRLNEDIEITTITFTDTNKFNMTVLNKGSITTKLVRLWVTDQSSNPTTHEKHDLSVAINPGEQKTNIGTGIAANPSDTYTLKTVTERGNAATFVLSKDTSTRIELIVPASVLPNEKIHVTAIIINTSTIPNSIANLTGTLQNNATLTPTKIPTPTSIFGFEKNEIATFSWTFVAPSTDTIINFNASYDGAPSGVYVDKIIDVSSVDDSQSATNSPWAEKARTVGILLSGLPNPMQGNPDAGSGIGKFGIGIINPLDRPVEVYALGIASPVAKIFEDSPTGVEPTDGWSRALATVGEFSLLLWESSETASQQPRLVPGKSIVQFRVESTNREDKILLEAPLFVESLTSEGKLLALYAMTSEDEHPTISLFYTDSAIPPQDWTYKFDNAQGGQETQYNVTIANSSTEMNLNTEVALAILIPKDFTNVNAASQSGWDPITIVQNPDGSHFIKVNTTNSFLNAQQNYTLSFNATAPVVTETTLYVFPTTSFYPKWLEGPDIASALSELGVKVSP